MKNYYRICAEINLDNIYHNICEIKKKVGDGVRIMPVIKADGYGHGAVSVAKKIMSLADMFAVAVIEEAIELRAAHITKPIMILGTLPYARYEEAVKYDVTVPVYTEAMALHLSDMAKKLGKVAKTHLAVDTGMRRIGMSCDEEGIKLVKKIWEIDNLEVDGIFTHFATADMSDKSFAFLQKERFESFCNDLESEGISIKCRHICNSAAITDMPDTYLNMVRPGIITYGLYPSDDIDKTAINLKPAMEIKSIVSYVKNVNRGEGISYGLTHVLETDRKIATIPVGYADGYPRLLSDKGRVIIHGQYAPIVGRICMDQFMVDVTHIDNVEPEDSVTLMGRDGECFIGADEIASIAQTISYEIICGIGKRVPRIYHEE
ncbi:MAG: alanine racemase [Clostridia bacterium]|nr:alanine racemase [Clostridia bacterium]